MLTFIDPFVQALIRLQDGMDTYLEENDDSPVRKDILDFSLKLRTFLRFMNG